MDWLDRTGIVASSACAIHCGAAGLLLAIPALMTATGNLLPSLGHMGPFLLVASLACALVALGHGAVRHARRGPLLVGLVAGGSWIASEMILTHDNPWAAAVSMGSGALLVVAHAWNLRCARRALSPGLSHEQAAPCKGATCRRACAQRR